MDKKAEIEDILAQCLTDLERGGDVEGCLARYPGRSRELEPPLRAAEQVRAAPHVIPSVSFRQDARSHMVAHINARTRPRERTADVKDPSFLNLPPLRLGVPVLLRRLAVPALAALTLILLLGGLGIGGVYASSESLPGDLLYPVKLAGERTRLALSLSGISDARLRLTFASERVEEAARLIDRHEEDHLETLMHRYAADVEAVSRILERQRPGDDGLTSFSATLRMQLREHQTVLNRIRTEVSEEAQPAVERAIAASRAVQRRALEPRGQPQVPPTATPTSASTATATMTSTSTPSETPRPTETSTPTGTGGPAERSETTRTPEPPGQTVTPESPGKTWTPEPPERTITPGPSDQTVTPESPGRAITPRPPGRTMTPEPPGPPDAPGPSTSPVDPGTSGADGA